MLGYKLDQFPFGFDLVGILNFLLSDAQNFAEIVLVTGKKSKPELNVPIVERK